MPPTGETSCCSAPVAHPPATRGERLAVGIGEQPEAVRRRRACAARAGRRRAGARSGRGTAGRAASATKRSAAVFALSSSDARRARSRGCRSRRSARRPPSPPRGRARWRAASPARWSAAARRATARRRRSPRQRRAPRGTARARAQRHGGLKSASSSARAARRRRIGDADGGAVARVSSISTFERRPPPRRTSRESAHLARPRREADRPALEAALRDRVEAVLSDSSLAPTMSCISTRPISVSTAPRRCARLRRTPSGPVSMTPFA